MNWKKLALAVCAAWGCLAQAEPYLTGRVDKDNPVGYRVGEPIEFRLEIRDATPELSDGSCVLDWLRLGDDGRAREKGRIPLDGKTPLVVRTSLDRPGFVFVKALVLDANGKPVMRKTDVPGAAGWEDSKKLSFSGGAGVEIDSLACSYEEPADFDAFWARQKARDAAVPVEVLSVREIESPKPGYRQWSVTVASAGPRPVCGFLAIPEKAAPKSLKAVLACNGYGDGVSTGVDPSELKPDEIRFNINAHGFDFASTNAAEIADYHDGIRTPKFHYAFSPFQNEYPEGCYFNGMALRVLRALRYLKTRPEWNGRDLECEGGSQGGLQTLWAASLCEDLTAARAEVPWGCDWHLKSVPGRMYWANSPDYAKGMAYYDSVFHGRRAKCRVDIVRAGLGDRICSPGSIAVLYNNLDPKRRSVNWVQGSTHGFIPPPPVQCIEFPSGKTVVPRLGANVYTGDKAALKSEREAPLRVGVYVGEGTFGLGAPRWAEIVHFSPELQEVFLDAAAITNGTLDACAAIILPEGDANAMGKALGTAGLDALRAFIEKGGHCLASDGGAQLLMMGSIDHPRADLLPHGEGEGFGVGATDELQIDFVPELARDFSIRRAERRRLDWEGTAPFVPLRLEPSELDKLRTFRIAARFRGNLNLSGETRKSLRRQITDLYGTFGKGRVWATIMHSEYTPANVDVTQMLLEYVLGRKVTWQLPQRERKQLAVSVIVDGALGVGQAKALMRLLDDKAFDTTVMTQHEYDGFWLRHSDAVVKAGELSDATFARLKALGSAPEEPATVLKRVRREKPVKAVLYCGPGVGDAELFNFATILDDSPKYEVECQDGSKFASGSLKGKDFLLVAGGYSSQIYYALKPANQVLRDFLFAGGTYYGACAGSFVTLQVREGFQTGLNLVPFTARSSPYRGHSHPHVVFDDQAMREWGLDRASHEVLYWGGPEHEPGQAMEDTDVKVLARYACSAIDTYGGNNLPMKDWSAIIGGRLGNGKIVSTAVHPEEDETQFYLVYAGLRYLHGEQPAPQPINRRRGALTVGYYMPFTVSAAMMSFVLDLRRDTRFDVRPQSGHMDIGGYGRHLDVYVFGNGFKEQRLLAEMEAFFRRGGHGIFITNDPSERAKIAGLTKGFANVRIVATHAEARTLLENLAR